MVKKRDFLCYYELHVDDKTFYVHRVIRGTSLTQAMAEFDKGAHHGKHYHLQAKGILGPVKLPPGPLQMLREAGGGLPSV